MRYFNEFPVIDYNLSGENGNTKKVTDILEKNFVLYNFLITSFKSVSE